MFNEITVKYTKNLTHLCTFNLKITLGLEHNFIQDIYCRNMSNFTLKWSTTKHSTNMFP